MVVAIIFGVFFVGLLMAIFGIDRKDESNYSDEDYDFKKEDEQDEQTQIH